MNESILAAALLWLRNHYDVGQPDLKDQVLERIDRVLDQCPVKDQVGFREMFGPPKRRS